MRIHFLHRGHAERCLKNCRQILDAELSADADHRLPTNRVQNAFCQGLGYSSYNELVNFQSLHSTPAPTPDSGALSAALTKSFKLSLEVARTSGFRFPKNTDDLAERLSKNALRALNSTEPGPVRERYLPPPSVRFYRSTIEGRKFFAGLSIDGPYVGDRDNDVCLGASSIVELAIPWLRPVAMNRGIGVGLPTSRWVVVKYDHEERIDLNSLSEQGRLEFSRRFGVPISGGPHGVDDHGALFFRSESFLALCEWAKAHPRLAKRIEDHCPYIPTLPTEIARAIGAEI